jgi:hypothetical protein
MLRYTPRRGMKTDPTDPAPKFSEFPVHWRLVRALFAPTIFASVVVFLFADVLFSATRLPSAKGTDLTLQFIAWRHFGFTELAKGNLALWNPHIYGGTPFFAGFQSALLYPPNWLHLVLPLAVAINWGIALNVFLAGYFSYLWTRCRGASPAASILAGLMFMMCGPYFLHVYAGHLPHIAVMAWVPLILLAIDQLTETGKWKWVLVGAIALAMQILAGHPQYVFYTGIVATVYAALLIARSQHRARATAGFVAMYVLAVSITAVQLLPGFALTRETVRSGGLSYGMAGTFSLPPENFLTLLAPNVFGTTLPDREAVAPDELEYFGRGYLWELSLFVSVTGLALAVSGALTAERSRRRFAGTMVVVCIVLALGRFTPLYRVMYEFVPQYSSFRGTVKFAIFAVAFASMLAALGLDKLHNGTAHLRQRTSIGLFVAALLVGGIAMTSVPWSGLLNTFASARTSGDDNELFLGSPERYRDPEFVGRTRSVATTSLAIGAGTLGIAAATTLASKFRSGISYGLVALAAAELLMFTKSSRATAPAALTVQPAWEDEIARAMSDDARVIVVEPPYANSGMYFGYQNLWGYDPGVLKRFAELMTFSQRQDPDKASQYLSFGGIELNIFRALRCRFVLTEDANQPVITLPEPMPTALPVRNYHVLRERGAIFEFLRNRAFDPRSAVALESEPDPAPVKGVSLGTVKYRYRDTDTLQITAELATPAVLLVTNNFAAGWRARPAEPGGPQERYVVQPANWTHQAIALRAGSHAIVLEYLPRSFVVGRWISIITVSCVVLFIAIPPLYRKLR